MKILFIINPISGGKNKSKLPDLIKQEIKGVPYHLAYTNGPEHATQITLQGIKDGFTHFIAVGGDGTVNEVAKALIGTDYYFGILPFGSGNGLARHNKIPMEIRQAIRLINENHIKRIDTCQLNGMPFVNVSGVGFDAHIGKLFAQNKNTKRGFSTYINMTINEFKNYKAEHYTIKADGKKIEQDAFLITFANSSQYGNNAYIAPDASMTDGMIDVCIVKPFHPIKILDLGFKLFTKQINKSELVDTIKATEIEIEREQEGDIHLDGEPFLQGKNLKIKIVPCSLNLITPSLN